MSSMRSLSAILRSGNFAAGAHSAFGSVGKVRPAPRSPQRTESTQPHQTLSGCAALVLHEYASLLRALGWSPRIMYPLILAPGVGDGNHFANQPRLAHTSFTCDPGNPTDARQARAHAASDILFTPSATVNSCRHSQAIMVTRKPVAPAVDTAQASASKGGAPPYPTTPTSGEPNTTSSVYSEDLKTSPAFDLIDMQEARTKKRRDSDVSSHGTWDSDDTDGEDDEKDDFVEVPKPLQLRSSQQNIKDEAKKEPELPPILRPGPATATAAAALGTKNEQQKYREEAQSNPWQLESNNPYNKQNGLVESSSHTSNENSQPGGLWQQPAHAPPHPPSQAPPPPPAPAELPAVRSPTEELAQMQLEAGPLATPSYEIAETLPVPAQGQPPLAPVSHTSQALHASNPWAEDKGQQPPPPQKEALPPSHPQQPPSGAPYPEDDYLPPPGPLPQPQPQHQYAPPPAPQPAHSPGPLIDHAEPSAPQQPPPISTHIPASTSQESAPESPNTRDRRQRSEHYQIKHVNWLDNGKLRQAPVITQNLNGPCPLLALVNALVLSTPPDLDTALIEALRTREQVSLGLLLDAVFDELMSGRRGETAHQLPDVSELYSFLLALHTGMNVNPRFVTPVQAPRGSFDGHPAAMNSVHPIERAQNKPGCFEETREMRLYSTFNIPLIHGWTAPRGTPAYDAFERSAPTFEDAQNIQFAEAELEDKLRAEGLSFQEQQTLEDIQTIKSFLQNWPTQLTDHGLETISQSLLPGQTAILFRNDHFSTLYKEPKHGALMTLVTDAGYSSHAEIVWESLVDVNGAASEYFSGDFRSVSHGQDSRLNQGNSGGGNEGWQTVQRRTQRQQTSDAEVPPPLPGPRPHSRTPNEDLGASTAGTGQRTASEQEDHDLALALQLQEEEEDQQRQLDARRRREQELSEQFLSTESNGEQRPAIPPRRNQHRSPRGSSTNIPVSQRPSGPAGRPPVHRPGQSSDPDAPPSYEQSASDRPYRPAGATAPPTQGNPLNTLDHLRRTSAHAQQSSTSVNSTSGHGRRQSQNNRVPRRQSGMGSNGVPNGPAPPYGRVQGAANLKDTEERRMGCGKAKESTCNDIHGVMSDG
ncbi:uncharacterized protein MYCFIDRAFT_175326 [Pseudocercospora fijiensis CIRAD86]|uniref:MINDY deubiquitinase domain-containing protein n=1 Tax=Pseudocercospora fijiensis (strain CIRAD86) TaxID=383855 RepID=M3AXE6_PSEFD|nr:uncharacterized protein MYCFIDRAFT_175326 [Pseudocercospora fijiensis CIRAD86]EME81748.1 hypothetical protein MYCFIDRAFT_175326 [Pseudocercospora fijiensis CIRAD86]